MCGCHDLTCIGGCGCGCTHTLKMHDYAVRREAEAHLRKQIAIEVEESIFMPSAQNIEALKLIGITGDSVEYATFVDLWVEKKYQLVNFIASGGK